MTIENDATAPDTTPINLPDGESTDITPLAGAEIPDPDTAAMDAFSKGIEEAIDPTAPPIPKESPDAAAQAQAANQAPAAAVDPVQAGTQGQVAPVAAKPEVDAAVEAEIKALGLKQKAADRFRDLSTTVKAKDAEIEPLKAAQAQLEEWNGFLAQSTVSPKQLGAMIEVGRALNGNDLAKKGAAFDTMLSTLVTLGKELGREVPGLVDPLDAHPDLKAAVENGDITPELAKQQAALRASTRHNEQTQAQQTQAQQMESAKASANGQLAALGADLKRTDPFFEAKMAMMQPVLRIIETTMHPSQWAQAAATAYSQLPTPSAPVQTRATPAVGHMPLRPSGSASGMRAKPRSDIEAFNLGAYGDVNA